MFTFVVILLQFMCITGPDRGGIFGAIADIREQENSDIPRIDAWKQDILCFNKLYSKYQRTEQ